MDYKEEDYLQLSGIQHFLFCRRQFLLYLACINRGISFPGFFEVSQIFF